MNECPCCLNGPCEKEPLDAWVAELTDKELFDISFEEAESIGRNDVYDARHQGLNDTLRAELWRRWQEEA
jgi:hypothetical protein